MEDNELMGRMKVSKAVAKMAIPSVISSLVTVVYNMADTFFVGQTGDALQVAAVSLTNPIFILMMAFANMFGMGGSAVASMALGEQNKKRARNVSAFVLYASLIVGIVFMLVLMIFMQPVLTLFGADAETYEFARGYTFHISYGAPFIIWSAACSFVIRVEGASREAMIGSMIGTIANIVLDPVFISVFGMGATGAAIATTIGNVLSCLYFLWYFLKKSRLLSLSPKYFRCGDGILVKICSIGLANGVQPLLGYNYGAGNMERFQAVERFTKRCCLIVGIASVILYYTCRESVIRMFINDEEVIRYGVQMLIGYMLSGPVIGFLFMNMNCLQSVDHAFPATILSILRQGVLLIPLLYLLDALFGLNGVIYGQSVTDYIAVGLSVVIWHRARRNLDKKSSSRNCGQQEYVRASEA